MYTTVYLTGKHAPSGADWIHAVKVQQTTTGINVWTSTDHRISPIFFPWHTVERIGG